jgi:hypothetical protein
MLMDDHINYIHNLDGKMFYNLCVLYTQKSASIIVQKLTLHKCKEIFTPGP